MKVATPSTASTEVTPSSVPFTAPSVTTSVAEVAVLPAASTRRTVTENGAPAVTVEGGCMLKRNSSPDAGLTDVVVVAGARAPDEACRVLPPTRSRATSKKMNLPLDSVRIVVPLTEPVPSARESVKLRPSPETTFP